jgi:hypothetical protein
VYDYDLYIDSGKLVKLGILKKENGKYNIVKLSSASQPQLIKSASKSTTKSTTKTSQRSSSVKAASKRTKTT